MYNFSEDAIREAAYYIWKNNGCKQGTALSDWDAAIHQLSVNAAFASKKSNVSLNSCKKTTGLNKKATKSAKAASAKTALKNVKSIVLNPISAFKATSKK